MEYASILLALGGKADHQVPKYFVTPAEVAVLRVLHGDDSVTELDVQGELDAKHDNEALKPRTDRQEIERLRGIYSRQEGETVISPAVNALFGSGLGSKVPKTFADLELHDEQYAVKERKTKASEPTDDDTNGGYAKMSVNDLRAHAEKEGINLDGISKKADIIAAIELHDEGKSSANPTGSVFE